MAKEWTKEHARFIGRIIFADFLEYPLEKYREFIEGAEKLLTRSTADTDTEHRGSAITVRYLSRARIALKGDIGFPRIIAKVVKSGKRFAIKYVYGGFNKIYEVSVPIHNKSVPISVIYKLRRISSRNELTHRIIKGIIEHQKEYLKTGAPADLVPFSQVQLPIDNSWTSRLVNGLSVIIPSGEEKPLKWFFQTQRQINKRLIKKLLDKENEDLQSGKLKKPYTDNEIRIILEDRLRSRVTATKPIVFQKSVVGEQKSVEKTENGKRISDFPTVFRFPSTGFRLQGNSPSKTDNPDRLPSLSRWTVGHCRKDMGIPPAKRRLSGYKYPPLSANFSVLYLLTVESVQSNAPASPGIYEFRLKGKEMEYPKDKTNVIYIGRTMNIKKRLREHLRRKSKNHHIKGFLKKEKCLFRYILFSKDCQEEEKRLYKLFTDTYGSPPRCNRVRP